MKSAPSVAAVIPTTRRKGIPSKHLRRAPLLLVLRFTGFTFQYSDHFQHLLKYILLVKHAKVKPRPPSSSDAGRDEGLPLGRRRYGSRRRVR